MGVGIRFARRKGCEINKPRKFFITGDYSSAAKRQETELAKRIHTSRAALNKLLDEKDASLNLTTLSSAAVPLGKKVSLQLTPA
jgi:hypothetical protein